MECEVSNSTENKNLVKGNDGYYEVVIGLEVHAQILTNSKLFSGAGAAFDLPPNQQVALVDVAFPGMLPVINQKAIDQAVKTGLGLKAKINKWSRFDRKNYFYPDLPQGYQISQFQFPIIGEGTVEIETSGGIKEIGIERLHLEQDAGKLIHDIAPEASYLDLNRAGVALMEIVSKPDMSCGEEAGAYFSKLRLLLRYLGTCDGNMEQGSMRADVNVSVRKLGQPLGTRTETKNVNSIRFMKQAIEYEVQRQINLIEAGGKVVQETRLYDAAKGETRSMRSKEDAHDYRYFPCPDLLPVILSDERIARIKKTLPELPDDKRKRLIEEYGLSLYDATILSSEQEQADYYEQVAKLCNPKIAANWVVGELSALLKSDNLPINDCQITPQNLAELINLITTQVISGKIAKDVFAQMFNTGKMALSIVEEKGLKQVSNSDELMAIIKEIICENPKQVAQVKLKPKTFGWFVGQVMAKTGGKANPSMVNELLHKELGI